MTSRLQVIIVGAGLGGLAAGAFLREFADVTILETTSELKEVGAAVSIGGGGGKILRRFGIDLAHEGGIVPDAFAIWTIDGNKIADVPAPSPERFGDHLVSMHRADLHAVLLRAATRPDGPGKPAQVLLGHKVINLDAEAGVVTVENGTSFSADVIIGADGIRSNVRPFVVDCAPPKPSGESAYRLLVDVKDLPHNSPLLVDGKLPKIAHMAKGGQRKIVAYPIRDCTLLNLLAFVPDSELHEEVSEKWTSKGSIESMVQSYAKVAPFWRDVLSSGKDVGVWQMRDMDPLETWVKGRTILMGDAAHPMLPHQAAGALSSIEDAEALAVTLRSATRETVHECLQRAFRIRFKRASACQLNSRREGILSPPNSQATEDLFALWDYPGAERWEVERPDMVLSA